MERLLGASQRVRAAEACLAESRAELRAAMREASDAGYTLSAIGRALGITRQRVMRVLREAEQITEDSQP